MVHPSRFILMEYSARLFILQNVPPYRQRRSSPLIISLSFIVPGGEWSPTEECAFRLDDEPFLDSTFPLFLAFAWFLHALSRGLREEAEKKTKKSVHGFRWKCFLYDCEYCRKFDPIEIWFCLLRHFSSFYSCFIVSILALIYVEMRICGIGNYKRKSLNR